MSKIHFMAGNKAAGKHVIFIHGLGGNYETTWMGGKEQKEFWPRWLVGQGEDVCIWSVEYESKVIYFINDAMAFKDRAANISESLFIKKEFQDVEIAFIGHSMGGLIIKQIMRLASDQQHINGGARNFLAKVTGIAFLGTPHTGSDLSTLGNWLSIRILLKLLMYNPSTATLYLYRNNPDLKELNQWFREWVIQNPIVSLSLGESKNTGLKGWIVKPDSADAGLSTRLIMVDKDHNSICKPEDAEDQVYDLIKNFVFEVKTEPQTLWLNAHAGSYHSGWSGYSNWTSQSKEGAYIIDEKVKFTDTLIKSGEKSNAIDIINSVRKRLTVPGTSVRLVGLSGVGKTRFAQALFETAIGQDPLSKNSVYYTDTGLSPNPTPAALLEKLIRTGINAVLIVDNCAWDLHRTLSELLDKGPGWVSLLTIEYDIRDDVSENTNVIRMEDNSEELITTLIRKNYPYIESNSVHKITEFSGGNARMAIALASSVVRDGDISRLRDEELFSRLFNQRHSVAPNLQKTAEVLSLVYSLQFDSDEGNSDELMCLSQLSNIGYDELRSDARELQRRGLAQVRNIWMAVLPHPMANRLACLALENISVFRITDHINPQKTPRMFSSFTRRLGYLSDFKEAQQFVVNLMSPDGIFEKMITEAPVRKHSDYTEAFTLLANVAPVAPAKTLEFLSRLADNDKESIFCTRENPAFITITRLLRSLAYDIKYFNDCASMLYRFAESEKENEKNNSIKSLLSSLFTIHLSGTHATPVQRINFIREHIDIKRLDITLALLKRMLQSSYFTSHYGFDFGATIRDYGYQPETYEEQEHWYLAALELTNQLVQHYPECSSEIIKIITSHFRGLWTFGHEALQVALFDLLTEFMTRKGGTGIWDAVSTVLKFDADGMSDDAKEKLIKLEVAARPETFESKLEMFIFSSESAFYGLEKKNDMGQVVRHGHHIAIEAAASLADELVQSYLDRIDTVIERCLTEKNGNWRINIFAERLIFITQNKKELFDKINKFIIEFGVKNINIPFICGGLRGLAKTDMGLVNDLLDGYLRNAETVAIFPSLQLSVPLEQSGTDRILKHLRNDKVDISGYFDLANGQRHTPISDDILCEIAALLQSHKHGEECVLNLLDMRTYNEGERGYHPSNRLLRFCRQFIILYLRNDSLGMEYGRSYHLDSLAKKAFRDASDEELSDFFDAIVLCQDGHGSYRYELHSLLKIILDKRLSLLLNRLCPEKSRMERDVFRAIHSIFSNNKLHPKELDLNTIIEWGKSDAELRFSCIAQLVVPYIKEDGKIYWSGLSRAMFDESNNIDQLIGEMVNHFTPRRWSGSLALKMEEKRQLLVELQSSERSEVSVAANKHLANFDEQIARERDSELEEFRERNERFE